MSDEAGEVGVTPNATPVLREPPPSLGMVAHIWAGHVGPVDCERSGPAAAAERELLSPGDGLIQVPPGPGHPAAVE